jgi:type VI secretion system protein ImpC
MATEKGVLGGGMKFGVGDDAGPGEREPLMALRILAVADLLPRDPHHAGASAPEGPLRVDGGRFDDLFARLRPRIAVEVPSVLVDGRPARVDLSPTSLKSFRPDGLCAEVPLLRSLLDGRLVLDRLRDGSITIEQARAELERLWPGSPFVAEVLGLIDDRRRAPTPAAPAPAAAARDAAPPSTGSAGLAGILDLVDTGSPAPAAEPAAAAATTASSRVAALIASVTHGARTGVRPGEAVARVERALGAQIGAILQHPEVRRLERAWRGLRLLVERAGSHNGLRVDVISARPDEAADALRRSARGARSAGEPPIGFAVVDVEVEGSAASLARFVAIAQAAEETAIPCVLNATADLLGVPDLAAVERLDHKAGLFEAAPRAPWRSAVARHAARWVALACNGALARAPYDKGSARVREAVVHELPDDDGGYVWTAPAWLVGTLVAKSFRETGWPARITGAQAGVVENLPVRELGAGYEGAEGMAIPTETFLSTETQRALARMGVLAFGSAPNSDAAVIMAAPTAYVPPAKRSYDSASTEPEERLDPVSLGDQLFVARLAQFLRALCARIPADSDPAEVQPVLEAAVWELFDKSPPAGPELVVRVASGVAQVTVRPRRFLGVALEEMSLEVPLG